MQKLPTTEWQGPTKSWLTMMFVAYSFLLTVRLHFTYSMLVMMAHPLVARKADLQPCPNAVIVVGQNSTESKTSPLLHWTQRQQAVAMSAYFLGFLTSAFPGGVYANRDHERSLMLYCMSVTAATLALTPFAFEPGQSWLQEWSWLTVTFLRFLQGCAFGPTGPCGGTLAGKIIKNQNRSLYSTFMFSGTIFGGFLGHFFSGTVIPYASLDGSYFVLAVVGFAWAAVWVIMVHVMPYDRAEDGSNHSMNLSSTPWSLILSSMPFIGLLVACLGYGYLYSFITTELPAYGAKVLGGDAIGNGIQVCVPWFICWITSIVAGLTATSLINSYMVKKTTIRKIYAGIVMILSPLILLGVMIVKCNVKIARVLMKISVVLLGFERSSIRINSLDLCPSYGGSLIALCDVLFSIGNVLELGMARNLFSDHFSWNVSFLVAIIFPITCSVLFITFGSTKEQCWKRSY